MKKILFYVCLAVSVLVLWGCAGHMAEDASDIKIYYVNKEITGTMPVSSGLYDSVSGDADTADDNELVGEILDRMSSETDSLEYIQAVPNNVECTDYYIVSDILNIVFDEEYYTMDPLREILCRQALVATFVQLDGVDAVRIFVGDDILKDANGEPVGIETADSFVVNPGKQINSINSTTVTLYFANKEGTGLAAETQSVYYNSNVPLEKIIIEHLIAGPKNENLCASIPPETGLADLTVADGVCYVSFDSGFEKYSYNVSGAVVISSIVDSLTELSYVDRGQISINGDTSRDYRDEMPLSTIYERDMTYLSADRSSVVENE